MNYITFWSTNLLSCYSYLMSEPLVISADRWKEKDGTYGASAYINTGDWSTAVYVTSYTASNLDTELSFKIYSSFVDHGCCQKDAFRIVYTS